MIYNLKGTKIYRDYQLLKNISYPELKLAVYKQRFILVYRPMLGQSSATALDVKAGKACRTFMRKLSL